MTGLGQNRKRDRPGVLGMDQRRRDMEKVERATACGALVFVRRYG